MTLQSLAHPIDTHATQTEVDLQHLSTGQLEDLVYQARVQLLVLHKARIAELRGKVKALIAEHGIPFDEVFPTAKRRAPPARYENPDDPRETWSGIGRPPLWVRDAKLKGKTMEQLRIAPAAN
jgi:DNA-binding protein H-NS